MTNPPPTIFTVETDSAWVVILAVSVVTLGAAMLFRRLIGRPGGLASGVLLVVPLLLPLVAAGAFAQAALPELSVLRPASPSLLQKSTGLLHILLLRDEHSNVVTPYALTGDPGTWLVLIGGTICLVMLVRRIVGMIVMHRLVTRCRRPGSARELWAQHAVVRLARAAGMMPPPELLILPPGTSGAFAGGGRRTRILISDDLLATLDDPELEATLAHEVAHLEARDVPVMIIAGFLRDLVAWNPLAHIALRRLGRDREIEADRRAVALTGRPLDVASGLLKVCELVGRRTRRTRGALAFGRARSSISRRVAGLLALADGRVVPQRRANGLYALAALTVAVLGLQVGATVADRDLGAFGFVWGSPQTQEGELWAPKASRQHHGVAGGRHSVDAPRSARSARRAREARPLSYPDFTAGMSLKARNLPEWIRWMARRIRRVPPASLRWEGRQDWNMVPLVTSPDGFQVYRLSTSPDGFQLSRFAD